MSVYPLYELYFFCLPFCVFAIVTDRCFSIFLFCSYGNFSLGGPVTFLDLTIIRSFAGPEGLGNVKDLGPVVQS